MKRYIIIIAHFMLFNLFACNNNINNAQTESVMIYGNCDMCKATIEKAGSLKSIANVTWNVDTKIATLIFDSKKTNQDEILKRIAISGYDSDKFLAPDKAYVNLPNCCQYERVNKPIVKVENPIENNNRTEIMEGSHNNDVETQNEVKSKKTDINTGKPTITTKIESKQQENELKYVFENYFQLKDALVSTDGNTASKKAKVLLASLKAVNMSSLSNEEHIVWMKVMKDLIIDAGHIEETKDVTHQRDYFMALSKNIYDLIKVSKQEEPTYYQFCPMANDGKGANWLSKENAIKNPYYGNEMLTCGRTVETIK